MLARASVRQEKSLEEFHGAQEKTWAGDYGVLVGCWGTLESVEIATSARSQRGTPAGMGGRPERHDVFRDDTKHLCGVFPPGDAAWWSVLDAAIHHLTAVAGRPKQAPPRLGPGPGTCAQVSCSENTAVRWCNDVSGAPCLDSPRLALPYLILPCLPLPRFASPCLALRSCCNHSGAG